ncbi:hypothetical protein HDV00_001007, partial [Rhizophlyctis rosea]
FKIKTTTQMERLKNVYLQKTGLDKASVRFLWQGVRLMDEDTPEKLGMESGDKIDAMVQQTGGVYIL